MQHEFIDMYPGYFGPSASTHRLSVSTITSLLGEYRVRTSVGRFPLPGSHHIVIFIHECIFLCVMLDLAI